MSDDPTLIGALEPEQFALAKMQPLPRRNLSRGVVALLIVLRVYVMIAIPIVGYAFVRALLAPQ